MSLTLKNFSQIFSQLISRERVATAFYISPVRIIFGCRGMGGGATEGIRGVRV